MRRQTRIASWIALAVMLCAVTLVIAGSAAAQRGFQVSQDGKRTLISKDVAGQRWAVTRNRDDGTVTGNVFSPEGGDPQFVSCSEVSANADEVTFSCSGSDICPSAPCAPDRWSFISEVVLPQTFFLPVDSSHGQGTWKTLASLAGGARQEHPVVVLHGEIFVIGGLNGKGVVLDSIEAYDPSTDTWRSDLAPLPLPMHHANVAASRGRIYVLGFLTGFDFAANGRVFEYDPVQNRWRERMAMPAGSERGASGVAEIGGKIYVAGGLRGQSVTNFSAYDPAANSWQPLPDLPLALDHLAAGAVGGVFYALGGRGGGIGGVSAAVHAFDPMDGGGWTRKADMPTARGGVAGAVLGGKVYVLGGEGNPAPGSQGVFSENEAYDPVANRWETFAPMAAPRHGTGAAGLADRIYLPGGANRQGLGAVDTVDAFKPAATK